MTAYQVVMLTAGIGVVLYAAWVLGHMVADELKRTWKGDDPTTEVWMKVEDPRRSLVPVVDRDGRYVAVRPDKTEGWK